MCVSLCLLAGISVSGSALAGRDLDADEALALVREGRIQPLSTLLEQHTERLAGHLLDIELEYEDDRLVYEIEVIGTDGVVREFYLDAAEGTILKEKIED
ncbi:MAG: peptidase M4 [Oceanospirillales bacterium]|nr:peptidase M4 [Oceanospirillales bacterium]